VSIALDFAKEHNLDLATKGGGHATSGASSSDGGLVIDMSLIRDVTVDAENRTARVGGGATWADVDNETAKYGLACVGGTVNE
jgi:FAD/FMN-containing dehydrogenase